MRKIYFFRLIVPTWTSTAAGAISLKKISLSNFYTFCKKRSWSGYKYLSLPSWGRILPVLDLSPLDLIFFYFHEIFHDWTRRDVWWWWYEYYPRWFLLILARFSTKKFCTTFCYSQTRRLMEASPQPRSHYFVFSSSIRLTTSYQGRSNTTTISNNKIDFKIH